MANRLSPVACECCGKRWMVSRQRAMFDNRLLEVDLCAGCARDKHAPQVCRKCLAEDSRRAVSWYCARLAHAVQYHPRLLEIRENMPDDPADTGAPFKLLGRIPYPD